MNNLNLKKKSLVALLLLVFAVLTVTAVAASTEFAETAEWLNENPNAPTDYAFSIAVVGDTQILVDADYKSRLDDDSTNDTFYTASIYDWIVENSENKKMQYVLGLGDITQSNTDLEWTVAKDAITKMNGVVPYTLVKGALPHDNATRFNKYFASEEGYTSNLKGYYEAGSVVNTFSTFSFGELKYLIFSLDFGATDDILEWASGIIESEEYKDHKVIITTHTYLWVDGNPSDQSTPVTSLPDTPDKTTDDARNNGDEMWDKFVGKHENIQFILSGHFVSSDSDIVASQAVGEKGNIVTQMLVNPQGFDQANNFETGMVCMLYFSADGNNVTVEYYSTYRDQYYREVNQFDIDLTELSLDGGYITDYGLIPTRKYDPVNYPYVLFQKTPSVYNGVEYEYTFYGAYKTLMGNSAAGVGDIGYSAYHNARTYTKDGSVILLLRDIENQDDVAYSNMQYHPGNLTLDLGSHTMTDSHAYSTGLVYMYMKGANNQMVYTVKNGNYVMGDKSLISFGARSGIANAGATLILDNVSLSFKEGSTAPYFVSAYAGTEYSERLKVAFTGCTFDMTNAALGFRFSQDGHHGSVTVKGSNILNSNYTYNVNEYGYSETKPSELEQIALYQNIPSSVSADGATFVSDYTFYSYYKALYANSALGVTTNTGAYNNARLITAGGNEATLILLDNHEITSDANYSNLCYDKKDTAFDLRGYTLTDSNTHGDTMFYIYIKNKSGYVSHTFTIKNGSIVLGEDNLCNYSIGTNYYGVHLAFENVRFSWKESGGTASAFLGTTSEKGRAMNPITLKDCVIDLENAKDGIMLEAGGSLNGISFENTAVLNSSDEAIYTRDESDLYDGDYIMGKYCPIPYLASDAEEYPFVSFKKASTTIDGITYPYVFYKAHRVLMGNSSIVTDDSELGFASFRYAGDGTVLLMRRDFVDNADVGYSNFCYSGQTGTFDLDGHTLYDNYSIDTAIFHNHLKKADQNVTITVTGGSIVLKNKFLTSYGFRSGAESSTLAFIFDNMNISFAEGATANSLVGRSATHAGNYSFSFVNCVIDLENAAPGFDLVQQASIQGGVDVTVTDTDVINSHDIQPKQSITLYSDFVFNVYIPTVSNNDSVTVTGIAFGGTAFDLGEIERVEVDGGQYYKLSLRVAPSAAADDLELIVYADYTYTYNDGTKAVTSAELVRSVSVMRYLEDLVNGSTVDAEITLAKDILSYIRAVYVYEGTSEKLEQVTEFVDSVNGADYDAVNKPVGSEAKKSVEGMDSARLKLGSAPAFVFYPLTDGEGDLVYEVSRYVFALDGTYRLNAQSFVDEEGRTYILVSLPAWALDNDVEFLIDGTEIIGAYNLAAYYAYFSEGDDAELIALIERLMRYAEAAEAYRNTLA